MFITLAAHVAAMAPGTNIGAAHPVSVGGQKIGEVEQAENEKLENFVAAYSKTIAQHRRRNVEWAMQAVRESVAVTDAEALQLEVIDLVARDMRDLLQQVTGRNVSVAGQTITLAVAEADIHSVEMQFGQKIFNLLADPNVAYLLMMAGLLGLYLEFSNPGLLFPGVTGAICLLLALAAFQVLPINSTGIALILLGTALMIAEAFVPSFGVLGLGGIVAFVLGSFILFDTADEKLVVAREIIVTVVVVMSGALLAISYLVLKAQRHRPETGMEGLIGEVGHVMKRIAPTGTVQVHGEIWTAKSEEPIEIGESVQIQGVENLHLWVQRSSQF
jgi:membrane-bound serine protease (ClpP class)